MNYFFLRTFNTTFKDIIGKYKNLNTSQKIFGASYIFLFGLGTYKYNNIENYKYNHKYREDILRYD
tara:strand:- start:633 stop:830 length:198 start_codon:yes stop_codon:yes gene_type:complete